MQDLLAMHPQALGTCLQHVWGQVNLGSCKLAATQIITPSQEPKKITKIQILYLVHAAAAACLLLFCSNRSISSTMCGVRNSRLMFW